MNAHPVFRIGVVGHRFVRVPQAEQAVFAGLVGEVLQHVQDTFCAATLEGRARLTPELRLISALAEGADRMGAQQGLSRGFRLWVVLPFSPEEYEQDFAAPESVREFRDLLGQANGVRVLTEGPLDSRVQGYQRVGEEMASNSDLLVAIWDGEPARGPGGTAEVVESALLHAVPVVWVLATGKPEIRLLLPSPTHPQGREERDWRQALNGCLERFMASRPKGRNTLGF